MLLTTLIALQTAPTGFNTHNVLVLNVPVMTFGRTPEQTIGFYKEAVRRIATSLMKRFLKSGRRLQSLPPRPSTSPTKRSI